jgi:hypothetical protein
MEFVELGIAIGKLPHREPQRRMKNVIGEDRRAGTRAATFSDENPILGIPTRKPTYSNKEIMDAPPPPQKPRTKKDIEAGIG